MSEQANRHPVDQLADVRAKVKELEARDRELVEEIFPGEVVVAVGDEWIAEKQTSVQKRLDNTEARALLGPEGVKLCLKDTVVKRVLLHEKRKAEQTNDDQ